MEEGRAWLAIAARSDWGPAMAFTMWGWSCPWRRPPAHWESSSAKRERGGLTEEVHTPAVIREQPLTDNEAIRILEIASWPAIPEMLNGVDRSAWIRGSKQLKKEIPDTGAKLVPTGKYNDLGQEFVWQHPAGDLHKVYDILRLRSARRLRVRREHKSSRRDVSRSGGPNGGTGMDYANYVTRTRSRHAIQTKRSFNREQGL